MVRKNGLLITKMIVAVSIFAGFIIINNASLDPDLGWHLKVGEEIATTRTIPSADHYTNTMPGYEWVDHEWLLEAPLWWLSAHNGWWFVVALSAFLSFIPFLVWIIRAQNFSMVLLILLSASSATFFLGIRLQMVTFALFFGVFELLRRYFTENKKKKYLLGLPLIFIIWANLHAGFVGGLVLFAAYLGVDIITAFFRDRKISVRGHIFPIAIFMASFGGTFLNAYGWKLHAMIIEAVLSKEVASFISEFQPLVIGYIDVFIAAFICIVFALALRFYKSYPVPVISITFIFFILAARSMRHWLLFIIVAEPFLTLGVGYLAAGIAKANQQKPFLPEAVRMLHASAIVLFVLLFGFYGYRISGYQKARAESYSPVQAVAFLHEHYSEKALHDTVLFNPYGWGGYLIWKIPEMKVFVDGRMAYWIDKEGHSLLAEDMQFYTDEQKREGILQKHGITMILLDKASPSQADFWQTYIPASIRGKIHSTPFLQKLTVLFAGKPEKPQKNLALWLTERHWTVAYQDRVAVILTRP